jgi:hypothetical protein
MAQDPARTLLLLSERPHPWASLRDRLDGGLVQVAWRTPHETGASGPAPWAVAGEGDVLPPVAEAALVWWVGSPGPAGARSCQNWSALAAHVQDALLTSVGGVSLAPGCGMQASGRGYVQGVGWLETLIGAGREGVPAPEPAELRRMRAALRRRRLPLTLVEADGTLRVESEG